MGPRKQKKGGDAPSGAKPEKPLLTEAQMKELDATAAEMKQIGRKSTEQAFKLGDLLLRAAELLGPENPVGKWAEDKTGLSARTARLYSSVSANLGDIKAECIELSISPTVLFELPSATPEQRELVLQIARDTGNVKVRVAKAIIAADAEKPVLSDNPLENGGADGLKAIAAATIRSMVASLLRHLAEIVMAIMAAKSEKRVQKGKLIEQVEWTARMAHMELSHLLQPVAPDVNPNHQPQLVRLPAETPWARVLKLTLDLSYAHSWPDAKVLDAWLDREVLPILGWATSKVPGPEWSASPETVTSTGTVLPFNRDLGLEATRARLQQVIAAPKLDAHAELEVATETSGPNLVLQ